MENETNRQNWPDTEEAFARGETLRCRPQEGWVEETLYVPKGFMDNLLAKSKEASRLQEYVRQKILTLSGLLPRPMPEWVMKVNSRPAGKRWTVSVRSKIGHYLIADFALRHEDVEIQRIQDSFHLMCRNCSIKLVLPAESVAPSPPWLNIHRVVRGCQAEVDDGLYGTPYLYE